MSSLLAIEQSKGLVGRWGAWVLLPILFVHGLIRFFIYKSGAIPFNADEAIIALMARHINQLNEIPVFFYGQDYMGSLDAILAAIGYQFFGEHVSIIRVIQFILYCLWAFTTFRLIYLISQSTKIASIASLFFIIPTVNIFLYTSVSLGGYGEALVIGNCILLTGLEIQSPKKRNSWQISFLWFILGLLIGFGFWVFGLTLIYSTAVFITLVCSIFRKSTSPRPRNILNYGFMALIGLVIGLMPVIYHLTAQPQTSVVSEILGSAIATNSQGISLIREVILRLLSFLILGLPVTIGIRPPWSAEWLVLPLVPGVIFFWSAAMVGAKKKWKNLDVLAPGSQSILLVGLVTILGYLLTPFGNDPSGRYFLPLYIPMIWVGTLLINFVSNRWSSWVWLMVPVFLITYNALAVTQVVIKNPPGLTTQFDRVAQVDHRYMDSLIKFLRNNKITRGYTNYWVAYPLAFLSQEELIFSPALPYHEDFRYTTRDRRYPPYEELVSESSDIAYITTNHPDLDQYLRTEFARMDINWQEKEIGDFHIFYQLSVPLHAEEIGLGVDQ